MQFIKSSLWLNSGSRSRFDILLKFKESKEPIQSKLSYVD